MTFGEEAWDNEAVRLRLNVYGMANLGGAYGSMENDWIMYQPRTMFCVKPANDVANWDLVAMERAAP